ncbi:MAG: hypothetical protein ACTTKH_06140 [Treponema sp.]
MIGSFEKHSNSKFKRVELLEPTEIKTSIGVLSFKNTIYFWENGQIEKGELGNAFNLETSFGNFAISKVAFYETSSLKSIYYKEEMKGAKVKTILGEIPLGYRYSDSNENIINIYENGVLKSFNTDDCIISKECSYNNGMFAGLKIYDIISFYENGYVEMVKIPVYQNFRNRQSFNTPYGKIELKDEGYGSSSCKLKFYSNGKIKYIDLGYSKNVLTTPNLGKIIVNSKVEFWENGNIKESSFEDSQSFEVGNDLFSCSSISCYEDGKIHIMDGGDIAFWKNGNIKAKSGDYKDIEAKVLSVIPKEFSESFVFSMSKLFFDETGKKVTGTEIAYHKEYNERDVFTCYFLLDQNYKFISIGELDEDNFIIKPSKETLTKILKEKEELFGY